MSHQKLSGSGFGCIKGGIIICCLLALNLADRHSKLEFICMAWVTMMQNSWSFPKLSRAMITNPQQELEDQLAEGKTDNDDVDDGKEVMTMMMMMMETKWWRGLGKRSRCWQRAIGLLYTLKPTSGLASKKPPQKKTPLIILAPQEQTPHSGWREIEAPTLLAAALQKCCIFTNMNENIKNIN